MGFRNTPWQESLAPWYFLVDAESDKVVEASHSLEWLKKVKDSLERKEDPRTFIIIKEGERHGKSNKK